MDAETDVSTQTAAEWRSRLDDGVTEQERAEFARWLAADERHQEAFAQVEATWKIFDRLNELPADVVRIAPERTAPRRKSNRRILLLMGSMAAALAMGWLGWRTWIRPTDAPEFQQTVAAAYDTKRMDLPDGSVIRLNKNTEVVVDYHAATRNVRLLRGEAHFAVAKNPARPFVVQASGAAVQVLGTVFDVAIKPESVEVLVVEGNVAVAPPGPTATVARVQLHASEKLVLDLQTAKTPVKAVITATEISAALAWQGRRLEFDSAPVAAIIAEFNRSNVHQILIAPDSPELGRLALSGSFRADDPQTFVELIKTYGNVSVETDARQTILRQIR